MSGGSLRHRLNRQHFPPGLQGMDLRLDPNAPTGTRWDWKRLTDVVDLPALHPGILAASASSPNWLGIGNMGDTVQFDTATAGNWSIDITGAAESPKYRVDPMGMIHFIGSVEKLTASTQAFGSPIFTMPADLRYKGTDGTDVIYFPCAGRDNGNNIIMARMAVWGSQSTYPGAIRYTGPHFSAINEMNLNTITYLVEE